jgi:hypothetical protein
MLEMGDVILYMDKYTEDDNSSIAICAKITKSQKLAEAALTTIKQKAYKDIVLEAYRDYDDIFSKEASKRKPKFGPFDHAIDLKPGFKPKPCKLYPLSPSEQVALDEWLKEHLKKEYIQPSKSSMASPFFFVKKKDSSLHSIQDYRYLNLGTIKNAYPLPLIGKLINQLKGVGVSGMHPLCIHCSCISIILHNTIVLITHINMSLYYVSPHDRLILHVYKTAI